LTLTGLIRVYLDLGREKETERFHAELEQIDPTAADKLSYVKSATKADTKANIISELKENVEWSD